MPLLYEQNTSADLDELFMKRKQYPTDITDEEWGRIKGLIAPDKSGGRRRSVDEREIVNAIRYKIRSNCVWRMLPHDLPPASTVYHYYCLWRTDGTLERIRSTLREPVTD